MRLKKTNNLIFWIVTRVTSARNYTVFHPIAFAQCFLLGTSIIKQHPTFFGHFWTTYHVRRFLTYNVQYLGAFLDPPTYPKIWRHLWTFPFGTDGVAKSESVPVLKASLFSWFQGALICNLVLINTTSSKIMIWKCYLVIQEFYLIQSSYHLSNISNYWPKVNDIQTYLF